MTVRFCKSVLVLTCWTATAMAVAAAGLGCKSVPQERPKFERIYREVEEASRQPRGDLQAKGQKLSLACQGAPLHEILRYLAQETGASIVAEQNLDGRPVSLEIYEQDLDDVLGAVARRLGVQMSRTGTLYFLGQLRSEDKGVLVRRATRLTAEELQRAVATLAGENGRAYVGADGLIVVGDRVACLQRIHEMLDAIDRAEVVTWCVQLYLVSVSERRLDEIGLDVRPSLEVAYAFAGASAGLGGLAASRVAESTKLAGGLDAVLQAAREGDGAEVVAEPLFLVLDGSEAEFRQGQAVPIIRRTESQFGNVTATGYDTFQTGLTVKVTVREVGEGAARCDVRVDNSEILELVEGVPLVANESLDSAVVLESGGVYLVGSLHRVKRAERVRGWLSLGRREASEKQLVQVWARAYRISRRLDQ